MNAVRPTGGHHVIFDNADRIVREVWRHVLVSRQSRQSNFYYYFVLNG